MTDIDLLIKGMISAGASDLYLTVGSRPSFRIEGKLQYVESDTLTPEHIFTLVGAVAKPKEIVEFDTTRECNTAFEYKDLGRFRLSVFQQKGRPGCVIRRINKCIPTIEELNLPKILKELATQNRGLILLTGATGSGKSTTLASMVDWRNSSHNGHIFLVEDPIEFIHTHKNSIITQREIGIDTESWNTALKNALRQAPDVVILGEIRDRETMEAALNFADTGHLVIATLHAKDSKQTIERAISLFSKYENQYITLKLGLSLKAIISQRLIPALDGGRIPAVEVLIGSSYVQDLIIKEQLQEISKAIERSQSYGMQSFDDHLFELHKEGKISTEEALKHASSENNLKVRIKLAEESLVT